MGCGKHAYLDPSNIVLVLVVPIIALCGVCLVEDPLDILVKGGYSRCHNVALQPKLGSSLGLGCVAWWHWGTY